MSSARVGVEGVGRLQELEEGGCPRLELELKELEKTCELGVLGWTWSWLTELAKVDVLG